MHAGLKIFFLTLNKFSHYFYLSKRTTRNNNRIKIDKSCESCESCELLRKEAANELLKAFNRNRWTCWHIFAVMTTFIIIFKDQERSRKRLKSSDKSKKRREKYARIKLPPTSLQMFTKNIE